MRYVVVVDGQDIESTRSKGDAIRHARREGGEVVLRDRRGNEKRVYGGRQ